jgi:hypothetical protein
VLYLIMYVLDSLHSCPTDSVWWWRSSIFFAYPSGIGAASNLCGLLLQGFQSFFVRNENLLHELTLSHKLLNVAVTDTVINVHVLDPCVS